RAATWWRPCSSCCRGRSTNDHVSCCASSRASIARTCVATCSRRTDRGREQKIMPPKKRGTGKGYYMISAVALKYNIHPQTLRLYEREGLIKPSRTEGNTRLYSDEDLKELETILALTRDLGVNLAGVEIILNMRRKMERMQKEVNEFIEYVKGELARGLGDWEQRLSTALVPASMPLDDEPRPADDIIEADDVQESKAEAPAGSTATEPHDR